MKRKLMLAVSCLLLVLLTACQSKPASELHWLAAKKAGGLEDYVKEQADSIDRDALAKEAEEGDLSQQFKATALLCALEYRQDKPDNLTRFQFSYPATAEQAAKFLSQVNADPDAFWASMEDAFSPYDCYLPILASAQTLDGATLTKLLDAPSDKAKLVSAVERWIAERPGQLAAVGPALLEAGYFDGRDLSDLHSDFFSRGANITKIQTDTPEQAMEYVAFLRSSLVPALAEQHASNPFTKASEITGEDYFYDPVMIAVNGSGPTLQEPAGDGLPETIELEGRKVAALYRNPTAGEFDDPLPSLQLMGGFLLALPEGEAPATLAEADYLLVLTADFEKGDFYKSGGGYGKDTKVQQVNSRTKVDLYDAKTGAFLRHIGTVIEEAPDTVFASYDEVSLQYPVPASSDLLAYLYHNVNNPDAYTSLVDHTPENGSVLEIGTPVIFANWEITYHSAKVEKEFTSGMYIYTASDGKQFVRGSFTVTNRGLEKDSFLPMIYYIGEDPIVQVADSAKQNLYDCVDVITYGKCLNGTSLDVGESKEGELIFEVPDEVAKGSEPIYIAVSLGDQIVYYPLS